MSKVVIVSDFFYPHWTGIARSIFLLAQALVKQKRVSSVSVLTNQHQAYLVTQKKVHQLEINRFKVSLNLSRAKVSWSLLRHLPTAIKQANVILINSPSIYSLPSVILAKLFKKKVIIFHQGDLILPAGLINKLIQFIFDASHLIAFYLADYLVTYTGDYLQNSRLLPKFKAKTTSLRIPGMFHKQVIHKVKDRRLMAQIKTRRESGKFIFGFAGRLVEEKGVDVLLKAVKLLARERSDFQVLLAGESMDYEVEYRRLIDQLSRSCKDQVSFLGLLSANELSNFYQSLDWLILPSRSECFGLVQAEAMSFDKPVLVADVVGAREVVAKTGFGLIFKSGNPVDLADKMNQAMQLDQAKLKINYSKVEKYFIDPVRLTAFFNLF